MKRLTGTAIPASIKMTAKGNTPTITVNNAKPDQVKQGKTTANVNPWLSKGGRDRTVGKAEGDVFGTHVASRVGDKF